MISIFLLSNSETATSLRENKNKASFLLQESGRAERHSSQSHSALYWPLVANKDVGNHKEEATVCIFRSIHGIIRKHFSAFKENEL